MPHILYPFNLSNIRLQNNKLLQSILHWLIFLWKAKIDHFTCLQSGKESFCLSVCPQGVVSRRSADEHNVLAENCNSFSLCRVVREQIQTAKRVILYSAPARKKLLVFRHRIRARLLSRVLYWQRIIFIYQRSENRLSSHSVTQFQEYWQKAICLIRTFINRGRYQNLVYLLTLMKIKATRWILITTKSPLSPLACFIFTFRTGQATWIHSLFWSSEHFFPISVSHYLRVYLM